MTTTLSSTLVRPISAKVAVDPITIPIARRLSDASATTPNKATALAGPSALSVRPSAAPWTRRQGMSAEQSELTQDALPVVDVVIATHNRPQLLRAALDAMLTQTYRGRIAITVVFDRSEPDNSLELQTADRSVRVITNGRSPGLAGARNSGIESGSGDLVAFCDDDDEWLPTKIQKQVELLQSSSALTCVTGIIVEYEDRRVHRIPTSESIQLGALVRNRTVEAHPSTVLVRRRALLGPIGLVDEEIPGSFGEDFDWILRAAGAGSIEVVEEPLVRVRWGQSLFSQK